jgi:hypothetical protein
MSCQPRCQWEEAQARQATLPILKIDRKRHDLIRKVLVVEEPRSRSSQTEEAGGRGDEKAGVYHGSLG